MERKRVMPRADHRNPWMGLNGRVCKTPAYWCRLHEVWLSEEDAAHKKCMARPTYDLLGEYRCGNIERRTNPWIHNK